MSTTAASGLLAILVCAMLQGNPLQLALRVDAAQACLLHNGAVAGCARLPTTRAMVDTRRGHR